MLRAPGRPEGGDWFIFDGLAALYAVSRNALGSCLTGFAAEDCHPRSRKSVYAKASVPMSDVLAPSPSARTTPRIGPPHTRNTLGGRQEVIGSGASPVLCTGLKKKPGQASLSQRSPVCCPAHLLIDASAAESQDCSSRRHRDSEPLCANAVAACADPAGANCRTTAA